jgi:Ca2+-binding RTX toxin-like protein
MIGGAGDDTYGVDQPGDVVVELPNEGTDTVVAGIDYTLGPNVENLSLTGSAIRGTGNELNNVIYGQFNDNTNNILDGKAGADTMRGFGGDDTYYVDNPGDVVIEDLPGTIVNGVPVTGGGFDTVFSSVSYVLPANVEALYLVGPSAIAGTGNAGPNFIYGNEFDNTLDGGAGADEMYGGLGNDNYVVDDPGDKVIELPGQGNDTVYSSISYTLGDNVENLQLLGTANLNGTGNALANILIGNAGNNTLDGLAGADTMIGGLGDDTYVVDNPGDTITELPGQGNDSVYSSVSYTLPDNVENLRLLGTANLTGIGNALDNILIGNSGNNTLDGGGGTDTAVFSADFGSYFLASYNGEIAVLTSGGDGHDRLFNVEDLQFADKTIGAGSVEAFDPYKYIASYSDLIVALHANGQAGFDHYIDYGFTEGRSASFDGLNYIASYGDLIQAFGANTVAGEQHFIQYGYYEGRHASFDGLDYIASYGDLIQAFGVNAEAGELHFIQYGYNEGRHVSFDGLSYIASYGDLIQAFGANAQAGAEHFIQFGFNEGRHTSFDGLDYIASYGDLIQAFGANADAGAQHFIQYGHAEGRHISFDALDYIASYGDLIQAFGANADAGAAHFIQYGYSEGRHASFDSLQYVVNYSDLYAAFGTNLQAADQHFIQYGYTEGRTDQIFTDATGERRVAVEAPNAVLNASASNDVFVFTNAAATGNASVSSFDPTHDAVGLNHTIPGYATPSAALATVQADPMNAGNPTSTHIQLDANDSITLVGVHPSQLTQGNFASY